MTTISWGNRGTTSAATVASLEVLVNYAADYINGFLAVPISFDFRLRINNSLDRAGGGGDVTDASVTERPHLWEQLGAYQSRTGTEVAGYDAVIEFNQSYLNALFFDATPLTAGDLASGKTDALSVVLHKTIHAIAFNGWTNWANYSNSSGAYSPFDYLIDVVENRPYFIGENAVALYGQPVPLTAGNVFHVANQSGPGQDLIPDLMNGVVFNHATRYDISDLDLAIFADLGIGTVRSEILHATSVVDNMRAGVGDDVIVAMPASWSVSSNGNDRYDGGDGFDALVLSGLRGEYSITRALEVLSMFDNRAGSPDGTDTVLNIEVLTFADRKYDLTIAGKAASISSANLNSIIDLYVGYQNRVPEASGLGYWIDQFKAGMSLAEMSRQFYDASIYFSSVTGYTANMPLQDFIRMAYINVLSRGPGSQYAPTQGEINYWVDEIGSGRSSREGMIARFLSDSRLFANDPTFYFMADFLDNKVELGRLHAVTYGLDYLDPFVATTMTKDITALVTANSIQAAVDFIGLSPDDYLA